MRSHIKRIEAYDAFRVNSIFKTSEVNVNQMKYNRARAASAFAVILSRYGLPEENGSYSRPHIEIKICKRHSAMVADQLAIVEGLITILLRIYIFRHTH